MHLLVTASIVLAGLTGSTNAVEACPPIDACVVKLPSTVKFVPPASALRDRVETPRLPALDLALTVRTVKRLAPGEIEMPWIWGVLRDQVYSRMPTYEDKNELKIVLSPVVVTSPSDTVPGFGIAGDF